MKGQAHEFDAEFLAFSREESLRYFQMRGINDDKVVDHIWRESEGWAAALWLNLQSYLKHGAESLSSQYSIDDLFEKAIFSGYAPDDQKLLMQLATVPSFTADQAAYISNIGNAAQHLIRLYQDNAMLTLDASGQYRMHSMFRHYLVKKLAMSEVIDSKALFRRVAQSHLDASNLLPALQAFREAGDEQDYSQILNIFSRSIDPSLMRFDPDTLLSIMAAIPWSIRLQQPIAYLNFIYCYMTNYDIHQGIPLLIEAEQYFSDTPLLTKKQKKLIRGEIILIKSLFAINDFQTMRDIYAEAHTLLGGRSSISRKNLIWIFGSPHIIFQYLREPGQLQTFVTMIHEDLHYFQELAEGSSAGAEDIASAELALETGDFGSVKVHLLKSLYHAKTHDQVATYVPATFTEARMLLAQGDSASAQSLFKELEKQILPIGNNVLNTAYDLAVGYCAACLGHFDAIPEWLRAGSFEATPTIRHGLGFAHIVYAKALLLQNDYQRLLAYAQSMPHFFERHHNLLGFIHAYTLEAIAIYKTEGLTASLPVIQKAIDLARPDHIVLTIAEYGEHILPIIKKIRNDNDDYVSSLLHLTELYVRANSNRGGKIKEPHLTRREKEILQLVAKGKSNQNIATYLDISPHTVAKTLSNIYQKLNTKNRIEAIRKYRQQVDKRDL